MTTPSQTVGPFFGYALPYDGGPDLVPGWHAGAIRVHGRVVDGAGDPIPDAVVEIWQADGNGDVPRVQGALRREDAAFNGFGRCETDLDGRYHFTTVRPGATGDGSAPYIAVQVFMRGLLRQVFTRLYFPEDTAAHAADPMLSRVPAGRRATLVAEADGERAYRFDIRMQGERETVFFAF